MEDTAPKMCRSGRHELSGHNAVIRGGQLRCRACHNEAVQNSRKKLRKEVKWLRRVLERAQAQGFVLDERLTEDR